MSYIDDPIKLSYHYDTDAKTLWKALTELDAMRKWFFADIPDFKAQKGFEVTFDVKSDTRVFPHHWTIVEIIPLQKLVYNWNYVGYDGDSHMIFELIESSEITILNLTIEIIEDFDYTIPELKKESWIAGWNYFMNRLKQYLIT